MFLIAIGIFFTPIFQGDPRRIAAHALSGDVHAQPVEKNAKYRRDHHHNDQQEGVIPIQSSSSILGPQHCDRHGRLWSARASE
ncbi:hypothetical protein [Rhizobium grahamii]|uniref:hypothetical protein n=1 Tax=Rhizobium grahamii TaxID=1120045 RepID=UPI0016733C8B|nr:hypothetical protein [Rhizobium grahamii]